MEISKTTFQKTLSNFLPHKYKFVERVEIDRGPYVKYGMFVLELTIITKDDFIKKMKPECKENIQVGDVVGFWTIIKCFGKFYNTIGLERDIESVYSQLSGDTSYSRDITVKMKIY